MYIFSTTFLRHQGRRQKENYLTCNTADTHRNPQGHPRLRKVFLFSWHTDIQKRAFRYVFFCRPPSVCGLCGGATVWREKNIKKRQTGYGRRWFEISDVKWEEMLPPTAMAPSFFFFLPSYLRLFYFWGWGTVDWIIFNKSKNEKKIPHQDLWTRSYFFVSHAMRHAHRWYDPTCFVFKRYSNRNEKQHVNRRQKKSNWTNVINRLTLIGKRQIFLSGIFLVGKRNKIRGGGNKNRIVVCILFFFYLFLSGEKNTKVWNFRYI